MKRKCQTNIHHLWPTGLSEYRNLWWLINLCWKVRFGKNNCPLRSRFVDNGIAFWIWKRSKFQSIWWMQMVSTPIVWMLKDCFLFAHTVCYKTMHSKGMAIPYTALNLLKSLSYLLFWQVCFILYCTPTVKAAYLCMENRLKFQAYIMTQNTVIPWMYCFRGNIFKRVLFWLLK